ncbi:MAG: PEP-CTERM sorting domain-containing protein [Rhodoferax sp.]|nr:PEP-CTERM sorting domain-containing protein [Rhodoferax sp.]
MGFKYAVAVDERLDHFTDIDSFAFNGVAGTGVRLTVASATLGLDPALRVWDPIGNEISSLGCNGTNTFGSSIMCISSVDLNLASSGVYKFSVSDTGYDELGDFRFQVSCLFGACPSPLDGAPIPSPIPEPETYALLMAGLGVIGMVVRRRQRRC